MGLPSQYNHPEYGVCLTLQRALLHLREQNIAHRVDGVTIILLDDEHELRRVEPLALAVGRMYALRDLQGE
jgi:hypothetical protein